MKKEAYKKYAQSRAKKSNLFKDSFSAYLVGGIICMIGQALFDLYSYWGLSEEAAGMTVSITLIFFACLLTGIGWFDKLAQFAGAGTLVPITGFANSIASPSIDNKAEGLVLGLAAKMFIIAGPVIVYGTLASVVLGVILFIMKLLGYDIGYIN